MAAEEGGFQTELSMAVCDGADSWARIVSVADADAYETTVSTKKEVDFLLRAWLSPLPPPAVERLSDLA